MMVVLDTHTVLWWTLEPSRVGRSAARVLADAERIGIPTIVFWETALLVRRGRVQLELSVSDWAARLLAIPRVQALPLDANTALRADSLTMHADPADRFIVATALEQRSRLVTKDGLLRNLKIVETIW
jgi:PIN domain nuclease of toxin-antitoxin system